MGVALTRAGWGVPHSQVRMEGYPGYLSVRTGLGTTLQDWMGYPAIRTGWGSPPSGLDGVPLPTLSGLDRVPSHQEIGRQSSYAACGMPPAFKQEDFLVCTSFISVVYVPLKLAKGQGHLTINIKITQC